jgi:hypothetical protein
VAIDTHFFGMVSTTRSRRLAIFISKSDDEQIVTIIIIMRAKLEGARILCSETCLAIAPLIDRLAGRRSMLSRWIRENDESCKNVGCRRACES